MYRFIFCVFRSLFVASRLMLAGYADSEFSFSAFVFQRGFTIFAFREVCGLKNGCMRQCKLLSGSAIGNVSLLR